MNSLNLKLSTFYCCLFPVVVIGQPLLQGAQQIFFKEGFRDFASSWNVALGDLDNDGDLDVAMLGGVFVNDGNGEFAELQRFRYRGYWATGFAWGDLNSNGFNDLWIARFPDRDDGISDNIWINQKDRTFSRSEIGNSPSLDVALGDVDGDGDLDAWVVNGLGQSDRLWLNNGFGEFSASGLSILDGYSVAVELADMDGDSDLDAWVAKGLESGRYYSNDGFGGFELKENAFSLALNRGARALVVGDVNFDGFPDGFVARKGFGEAGGEVELWVNRGNGTFRVLQVFGDGLTYGMAIGDLDGDSDLDIWLAREGPDEIWLNDGASHFVDSGLRLGDDRSMSVALGDLDGDGDLDAIVASAEGNSKVWINTDFPLIKSIIWQDGFIEIDYSGNLYEGASPNGRFRSVRDATSPYKVKADFDSRFFLAR